MSGERDGAASVSIDPKLFWSRLNRITQHWKQNPAVWRTVDALLLLTGPSQSEEFYSKLIALQLYLFGYEIPDSALLLTRDSLTILTSSKKARILGSLQSSEFAPPNFECEFLETNKADKSAASIAAIQSKLDKLYADKTAKKIGEVSNKKEKEQQIRGLAAQVVSVVVEAGYQFENVSAGVGSVLSISDEIGRECMTVSGELTRRVLTKHLLDAVEGIIDEAKPELCSKLADQCDAAIKQVRKLKDRELSEEDVDSCYTPLVRSGRTAVGDLAPSAESPETPLVEPGDEPGTAIVLQLGARYRNYCTNIGRTYFIDPTAEQKAVYQLMTDVYLAAKDALRPGIKAQEICRLAKRKIIQSQHAALEKKFVENVGFGIGLEFRDAHLVLNENSQRVLQEGMAICLRVGFADLQTTMADGQVKHYAVYLSDTFLVSANGAVLLTNVARSLGEISYTVQGADEGADSAAAASPVDSQLTSGRSTRHGAQKRGGDDESAAAEKLRAAHQAELARKQREIALKKLAAEQMENQFHSGLNVAQDKFQAYTTPKQFPPAAKPNKIYVDVSNESLLLPIHDQLVPFHIHTVKNVHKQEEGQFTSLRITFLTPDPKNLTAGSTNPLLRYISELTYRTASHSLEKVFFDIRELRKRVQNRIKEFEAKSSLVEQEELVVRRDPIVLKDVLARPQLSRKKASPGSLFAHTNGLRYVTTDKAKVDIIYSNIRACFYQPAQDTHQVLLHFELKHAILIDKSKQTKKTSHFQVYYEVVDVSEDLGTMNRYRDEDGLMEEQQERIRRKRWNEKFLQFVKDLEARIAADHAIKTKIEFDIPYRELAFTGVPAKATVDVMPTVHSLVALDDQPPLVLMLAEVEIAVFERVQFGLKNFDLVFVFKDFSKPPARIDSIPVQYLESIKHWLNSCDIVFYESAQNLLWKAVMKHINADVEEFWRGGGWAFLSDEGAEGEGGGEGSDAEPVDEESEFELSSSEGEVSEDSEEYETASSEEGSDFDSEAEGSEDSDDESGEDWDELERKAQKQDRDKRDKAKLKGERDFSDDEDDDSRAMAGQRAKQQQPPPKKKAKTAVR